MIPKIIHHIAPADYRLWHPLWKRCYPSWQAQFKDAKHVLWNDREDIDGLFEQHFPDFLETYKSFPVHMMRIDVAKFAILYVHGGIYADMDTFCYQDFHHELTGRIHLQESCYYGVRPIENAIIASEPGHELLLRCLEESQQRFAKIQPGTIDYDKHLQESNDLILETTGPHLLADIYLQDSTGIDILPGTVYNNHGLSYHPDYRAKHMLTGLWGAEAYRILEQANAGSDMDDFLGNMYMKKVEQYGDVKDLPWDQFDFYRDYTNGAFAQQGRLTNDNIIMNYE